MLSGQSIVNSRHNLSVNGPGDITASSESEICIFCHTPHGAATSANVPLWNKVLGDPASYTQYSTLSTPTFDSTEAPVGSVSLACLSCHDGTIAMDNFGGNTLGSNSIPGNADLDIDLSGSYVIGDKESDYGLAETAGLAKHLSQKHENHET